jgi:hypothetical protein
MSINRAKLLQNLLQEAERMLQGTVSETHRTCGNPRCHCHRGQLHGPHTYLTFKKPGGNSSGVYVPVAARAQVQAGCEAWKRFWQAAVELAADNRARAVQSWRAAKQSGRRQR